MTEGIESMHSRYTTYTQRLIDAILSSPGETDPALRKAVKEYSSLFSSHASMPVDQMPAALNTYVKKVALHAYKVTEEDVERLRTAGYNEDAIFEITLSAALGAGMTRLESGLAALKGGTHAAQDH